MPQPGTKVAEAQPENKVSLKCKFFVLPTLIIFHPPRPLSNVLAM